MKIQTKKITLAAMLCALAYITAAFVRIPFMPAAPFLNYDPKDIIIALGGLILGPLYTLLISAVSSFVEFVTVSDSGIIGLIMNVLSSCAFAFTAALIYKKKKTLSGAVIGLIAGCAAQTVIMILWNYIMTPAYMGVPRAEVAKMLIPVILPFNIIKSGLNAALTFILYRPVIGTLRKAKLIPRDDTSQKKTHIPLIIAACVIFITCVLVILSMRGVI